MRPAPRSTGQDPPSADLFRALALAQDPVEQELLTEQIVRLHLPSARAMASRYRDRGVPIEDLMQVAALGLVKAVRGYHQDRGAFMAYATPTISGEIKRYFRDTGWAVRPTRRLLELRPRIARATEELTQSLGRAPTVRELTVELGACAEDVIEAMSAGSGYNALSLDAPPGNGGSGGWADLLPHTDTALASTPDRLALQRLLAELPPRDRSIVAMRFFGDMTQSQIGAAVGVTQMQVSRLLGRALQRLREGLEAADAS